MIGTIFFYLSLHSILVKTQAVEDFSLWSKHYITYSIENKFNNTNDIINAINEWNIEPILEYKHVPQGQGDIKFYVVDDLPINVSGRAQYPELGRIRMNRVAYLYKEINITKVYQHEFGHALGMKHSSNNHSVMYYKHGPHLQILESDKELLKELYKCRYDSVTLLNGQTYLKFIGRYYKRIDLDTENIGNDTLWHPSITKVTTMYRNNSRYFIIQDKTYYQFDMFLKFEKSGHVREISPNIKRNVTSILTLNNGTIIYFLENNYIWHNNVERRQRFNIRYPENDIQGSYSKADKIYLVSKDDLYVYNENFKFLNKTRLCDDPKLSKIHCCNIYSNMTAIKPFTDDSENVQEFD